MECSAEAIWYSIIGASLSGICAWIVYATGIWPDCFLFALFGPGITVWAGLWLACLIRFIVLSMLWIYGLRPKMTDAERAYDLKGDDWFAKDEKKLRYDAGIPFYRCVPADKSLVKKGELLPDDDIFEMLKGHRRFCISPCACLDSSREWMGIENCDHHVGVCLQADEMADYYLDDLHLGKEAIYEQAEALLKHSVEQGLALQTTYATRSEIICSCSLCYCGILQAAKMFPGDAMNNISHYCIEQDNDKWAGEFDIDPVCTMQAISYDEDECPVTDDSCIGCGQCVRACKDGSRILTRKPEEEILELPDDVWGAYVKMEENRRTKGALA